MLITSLPLEHRYRVNRLVDQRLELCRRKYVTAPSATAHTGRQSPLLFKTLNEAARASRHRMERRPLTPRRSAELNLGYGIQPGKAATTDASSTVVKLTRRSTQRSTLEVGVAYNTDLQRAREVLLAAVARVPKILAEPPPTINIAGFDQSSIGFNILYWHNSDVPSELAARTDLAIAVHQAVAADIPYPGLASSESTEGSRLAARLRRPIRRKGRDNGD